MIFFDSKILLSVIKIPLIFLSICWLLFLFDNLFHLDLYRFGIYPRTSSGLIGILFCPFIHASLSHLINNSLPILILGSLIFHFYEAIAWPCVLWIYLLSGLLLWIGGRNDNNDVPLYHIGASILVYGFATFLFFSGIFRKHLPLMVVSVLVIILYGGITRGLFPFDTSISWEGHLYGAISGVLISYFYRKKGPQAKRFEWN